MTQSLYQLESFINFRTKIYSLINCKNYHQLFLYSTETKMEKILISWNIFLASGSAQPWMIVCQLGRGAGDWGNPPKIGRNLNFSSGNFMKSTGNSRTFSWIQGVPICSKIQEILGVQKYPKKNVFHNSVDISSKQPSWFVLLEWFFGKKEHCFT